MQQILHLSYPDLSNEWMNEWMNEWTIEWMNEWMYYSNIYSEQTISCDKWKQYHKMHYDEWN